MILADCQGAALSIGAVKFLLDFYQLIIKIPTFSHLSASQPESGAVHRRSIAFTSVTIQLHGLYVAHEIKLF